MSLPAGASVLCRVSGGSINEAFKVALADGSTAFVKTRPDAGTSEYEREAAGLQWLAEADALSVPSVLEVSESHLALEWIEPGHLSRHGEEQLGYGLARMHASGASRFGDPGGSVGSRIGSLELPNDPSEDWPSFYRERRLEPLLRIALERNAISQVCARSIERVCGRISELGGPPEPPARLHGDLWVGNVLADETGEPWLIDPSVYGGHREVDLAMLRLFGSLSERVFAAYEEAHPLAGEWRERVALWQLAPLLVHAALFGGSYGQAVELAAHPYSS